MANAAPNSVYDLEPGVIYIVTKRFVDYHRQPFEVGELLTYESYAFLPYHGGYTVMFRGRAIYLQEDDQAEILWGLGNYIAVHDASGRKLLPAIRRAASKANVGTLGDFLLCLGLFLGCVMIAVTEQRRWLITGAGLLLFGGLTALSGYWWWTSRRKKK
jgi:hypothetical protein